MDIKKLARELRDWYKENVEEEALPENFRGFKIRYDGDQEEIARKLREELKEKLGELKQGVLEIVLGEPLKNGFFYNVDLVELRRYI